MKITLITRAFGVVFLLLPLFAYNQDTLRWQPWQNGYLDIHHINTGRGNAAFFVFPDGTTLLFDAGNIQVEPFEAKYPPLRVTPTRPDASQTPAQWIANYIRQVMPKERKPQIDYAVVSHFHQDHYASLIPLAQLIPIQKFVDRAGPDYNYPLDLQQAYQTDTLFQRYSAWAKKTGVETLRAGRKDQIRLNIKPAQYPNFQVRNVKANAAIWDGKSDQAKIHFTPDSILQNGKFNENPLSLALKISYGAFDYFTGGDMTGLSDYGNPHWFDTETPTAKSVGQVEALTLNHHGNRDATNAFFVKTLAPKVIFQQAWCSDQPGQEVFYRLTSTQLYPGERALFANSMQTETKVTLGPWFVQGYKSMEGHLVLRVLPDGKTFYVLVLDDTVAKIKVKQIFGPYTSY
jgi:beta-lactamase superfamily II metal-dependent hydrolase